MTKGAYYNEIDPYAAQWLRNLIKAGHINPGYVDERSIVDVKPEDLTEFTQCHFFAGIGVWSYALRRAGWPDDEPVWTGSCPCQPFSAAGKGAGFDDERHLWPSFFHLIQQCRPSTVFGEQVASKDGLAWLDLVQTDLEGANYTPAAVDLCAAGFGAPNIRQRLFWVADTVSDRSPAGVSESKYGQERGSGKSHDSGDQFSWESRPSSAASAMPTNCFWSDADWLLCRDGKWRPVEPGTFPLAHGVATRVGRLRAYGNAINASTAEASIRAYLATPLWIGIDLAGIAE